MCCNSVFSCIMAIISNLLIIYSFGGFSYDSFFTNKTYFYTLYHFNSSFVNGNIIFFSNPTIFFACSLKEVKNFLTQSFPRLKYFYLLCDQMLKLLTLNIQKQYVVQFLLLKNFLDYMQVHLFL